jgi:hypothetical protein
MVQPTPGLPGQVQRADKQRPTEDSLPFLIREISKRVKIIRFGIVHDTAPGPWQRLAGMFHLDRPVSVEEMLDVRGFEESADY